MQNPHKSYNAGRQQPRRLPAAFLSRRSRSGTLWKIRFTGTHVAGYICNFGFAGTDLMLKKEAWLARRAWGEWRNGRRAWLRTTWGNPCRFKSCLAHHFQTKGDSLPSRRVLLTRRKETVPIWYRPVAQELERKKKGACKPGMRPVIP